MYQFELLSMRLLNITTLLYALKADVAKNLQFVDFFGFPFEKQVAYYEA